MKIEKINQILIIVVIFLLIYIAFIAPNRQKDRIAKCFNIAVSMEKTRHQPVDDLEVTNLDIALFQKNFIYCISDDAIFK